MAEENQSLDQELTDQAEEVKAVTHEEVIQEENIQDSTPEEIDPEVLQEEEGTGHDQAEEIDQLKAQIDQLEDQTLRLQAEMANIQRSNSRERQEAAKYRSQPLAKGLVEALDNMERALAIEAKTEEGQAIHKGVEMVYDQILKAFKEEQIEQIDPIDQAFDPNFHQAVTTQPAEEGQDVDQVVAVLQKGYVLNDRVIRPAMVIVSA
ncbi:nucleotide exchange factor GrpE [Facklamia languida]